MFYDLFHVRGRGKKRCLVCHMDQANVWELQRGPEDESDPEARMEEMRACESCIINAMFDGISP